MQSQFRWAGHVVWMKDHCLSKKLLYGELSQGRCSQGGQKKHFKDTLKVSPLIAWNIWCRTETSGMKLSNVEQKSVKPEETQQLSCAGSLEKALPHQPLPPPFLVLTAQDLSVQRLVLLVICALTNAFFNHKVDQIVLIDYDRQRRE